ncbi:hypothetical protein CMEL01_05642 [Colletotrichum melonis]|uniref:Uncharacterized protein n=1 Tax=Colletotrichum melonis TaxID=1209925 RepID=A0AAI9UB32_9PEZI|nr:hypothetical protein CMEL01_05642 [Colletotrichum melonis]
MRDRGKTYHHSTTIDRDRVTCFKIGLPLMLIAGKSEERLARYTTGLIALSTIFHSTKQ